MFRPSESQLYFFSGPTPNSRDSSASITSPVGLTVCSHSYNKTTNCCHWWITVSCKMSFSHRGKISILKHQMTEELFSFLSITQLWWQAKSIIKENSELRHRLGWVCQTVYFGAKHNRISEEHNYSLFPWGLFIRYQAGHRLLLFRNMSTSYNRVLWASFPRQHLKSNPMFFLITQTKALTGAGDANISLMSFFVA